MEFDFLGIFTLVTGVLFLIFEIKQSNWMWTFQLLSAAAAMASFFIEDLYAQSLLCRDGVCRLPAVEKG